MKCIPKVLLYMTVIFLHLGCTRGFRPPPPEYEYWNGSSDLNIKVALLECGSPSPYKSMSQTVAINDAALMRRCMINSGFKISNKNDLCILTSNSLAACKPDAEIPTRSAERRLNSYYCTNYGKSTPECQPPGQNVSPKNAPPEPSTVPDSDANNYFEQNRYREQTEKLQQDMQNDSNRQMEKILRDTAPKNKR